MNHKTLSTAYKRQMVGGVLISDKLELMMKALSRHRFSIDKKFQPRKSQTQWS